MARFVANATFLRADFNICVVESFSSSERSFRHQMYAKSIIFDQDFLEARQAAWLCRMEQFRNSEALIVFRLK